MALTMATVGGLVSGLDAFRSPGVYCRLFAAPGSLVAINEFGTILVGPCGCSGLCLFGLNQKRA
jgi:hypothetical protein